MTAASGAMAPAGGARSGRRVLLWLLIPAALIVGVLALGAPNAEGRRYDPSSNGETGTKALVLLLQGLGAQVDVVDALPGDDVDVLLALPGQIPDDQVPALRQWVRRGHTLVVTDTYTDISAGPGRRAAVFGLSENLLDRKECTISALPGAEQIRVDDGSLLADVPDGAEQCFTFQGDAMVVNQAVGDGQVVTLGTGSLFLNRNIGEADNAVVAADLLAPRPGTRLAVLWDTTAGRFERRSLLSLLGPGIRLAGLQLGLAFLVYVFVRGRRLGRPIAEPQPVLIAGSELVNAVGNLMQQTREPARAAAILRAELRRALADRLGLPPGAPPELIADTAASRAGADPERVRAALTDYPVGSEQELLAVAVLVDAVREEVLHVPSR